MTERLTQSLDDILAPDYDRAYKKLVNISGQSHENIHALTTYAGLAVEWEVFAHSLYTATVSTGKLTRWAHGLIHEFPFIDKEIFQPEISNYYRLEMADDKRNFVLAVFSDTYLLGKITEKKQEICFYHPILLNPSSTNSNVDDPMITYEFRNHISAYKLCKDDESLKKIRTLSFWIPVVTRLMLPQLPSPYN